MPDSTSGTIGEAVDGWLQRAEADGLEASTVAQYRQLAAHIRALLPANLKLSQVTEARVEACRDAALLAHNRPMARKVFGALKAVLKRAKRAHVAAGVTIGQ